MMIQETEQITKEQRMFVKVNERMPTLRNINPLYSSGCWTIFLQVKRILMAVEM